MLFSRMFDGSQRFFVRDGVFSHLPFGGIWGIVLGALLIAAVVLLIVLLVRNGKKHTVAEVSPGNSANLKAIDALKIRFANGDITEEDYLKRKQILSE